MCRLLRPAARRGFARTSVSGGARSIPRALDLFRVARAYATWTDDPTARRLTPPGHRAHPHESTEGVVMDQGDVKQAVR